MIRSIAAVLVAAAACAGALAQGLVAPPPEGVAGPSEDFHQGRPAAAAGRGQAKVRAGPDLVPSELAVVEAQIMTFTHPSLALPRGLVDAIPNGAENAEAYAAQLWSCLSTSGWYGPGVRALDVEDRIGLRRLIGLYSLVAQAEGANLHVHPRFADDCTAHPQSRLDATDLGAMVTGTFIRRIDGLGIPDGASTETLGQFLTRLAKRRGARQSDIVALVILKRFGRAFRMEAPQVTALFAGFRDPASLLLAKTTPSLQFNNEVGERLKEIVPWHRLGMHEYSSWGYSPVHAWIAHRQHDHPVLFSLIPVVGAAFEAADSFQSFVERRDAAGDTQERRIAAGFFALNFVSAMFDVPAAKSAIGHTARTTTWLAKSARRAKTVEEIEAKLRAMVAALKSARTRDGVDVGAKALEAWTSLGRPTQTHMALLNRALGKVLDKSKAYLETMNDALGAVIDEITRLQSARLLPKAPAERRTLFERTRAFFADASQKAMRGAPDARLFGVLADASGSPLVTVTEGAYSGFEPMLERFAKKGRRFGGRGATTSVPADLPASGWVNQFAGKLPDGTVVPLGRVVWFDEPTRIGGSRPVRSMVVHWPRAFSASVDPSAVPLAEKALAHAAELFNRAIDPTDAVTNQQAIELVAEMHWWLVNLTPYLRGSNGIADTMSKAALRSRGIRVGMWKPDVSPDYWAFTHDLDDFKALYGSLFDAGDGLRATDKTLTAAAQGLGGAARYPAALRNGKPLLEGRARFQVPGDVWAITGYVASHAIRYAASEGASGSDRRAQGLKHNVRIVHAYSDGRPERSVVIAAGALSPGDMPADLLGTAANDEAGFRYELGADDRAAYLAGLLTVTVYAEDAEFEEERTELAKFRRVVAGGPLCPGLPAAIEVHNPAEGGFTIRYGSNFANPLVGGCGAYYGMLAIPGTVFSLGGPLRLEGYSNPTNPGGFVSFGLQFRLSGAPCSYVGQPVLDGDRRVERWDIRLLLDPAASALQNQIDFGHCPKPLVARPVS